MDVLAKFNIWLPLELPSKRWIVRVQGPTATYCVLGYLPSRFMKAFVSSCSPFHFPSTIFHLPYSHHPPISADTFVVHCLFTTTTFWESSVTDAASITRRILCQGSNIEIKSSTTTVTTPDGSFACCCWYLHSVGHFLTSPNIQTLSTSNINIANIININVHILLLQWSNTNKIASNRVPSTQVPTATLSTILPVVRVAVCDHTSKFCINFPSASRRYLPFHLQWVTRYRLTESLSSHPHWAPRRSHCYPITT